MTDRFVTVPDSLELPAAVKVPVARLVGPTGAAATPADLGAATAAQGAKADASDVDQITLTGDLVFTLPVGRPAGQVYRVVFTQDGTGGHTVTYGGEPVDVDTTAGAQTLVDLWPNGGVAYPVTAPLSSTFETQTEAADRIAGEVTRSELAYTKHVEAPRIASLIAGQADETLIPTNATITADTTNVRLGLQSWKIATSGAVTAMAKVETFPTGQYTNPQTTAIGVWAYVEDASKVTTVGLYLYSDASEANYYNIPISKLRGGIAGNIRTGWNYWRFARFHTFTPTGTPTWGTIHHAQLYFVTNAATSISLQAINVEHRAKASIVFIHDGGYTAFDQSPGYHDLRDRGIPVTFAAVCSAIDSNPKYVTRARLIEMGDENGNSISFHSWSPSAAPSSGFTADQARAETARCQKWLSGLPTKGATGRMFRAAWYQNISPQSAASNGMVLLNPMFDASYQATPTSWPPIDRFAFYRHPLHDQAAGANAAMFAQLQERREVLFVYTHNVSSNASDISPADWAEFLSLVDAGIAAGWLECVTVEQLMAASGVSIRQGMTGAWRVEWPEIDGTTTTKTFP